MLRSNLILEQADILGSPPFFQHITPPELQQQRARHGSTLSDPLYNSVRPTQLERRVSSSDEYRGVIDDLTIQNKVLKRKLRRYEKMQGMHLRDQKLFEVRVHGISPAKKRELEVLLRDFAIGLQASNQPVAPSMPRETSSIGSSSQQVADSAYVSGGAQSAQGSMSTKAKQPRPLTSHARRQNIQSYLHHVSAGLMPRAPQVMTDRTKKRLVVRRLENIFVGNGAGKDGHLQHEQQQEVSHNAAKDDRSAAGNPDQVSSAEGTREACIMQGVAMRSTVAENSVDDGLPNNDSGGKITGATVEQRPTRPLDLDPQRAQIAADNITYIRHLGFSPPNAPCASPRKDRGWIYLNILINMAQLHTVNVTVGYVQQAIKEHSKHFELSEDGRKVRWCPSGKTGGSEGRTSESGKSDLRTSPRKRARYLGEDVKLHQPELPEKLSYTPLFQHRSSEDSSDSSDANDDDDYGFTSTMPAERSTISQSRILSDNNFNDSRKRKRLDRGPIIFYNNASFCTDLCGEPDLEADQIIPHAEVFYHCATDTPLGVKRRRVSGMPAEVRGPLEMAKRLPEARRFDSSPKVDIIRFAPQSPLTSDDGQSAEFKVLEASGIGGVRPADNFAINVQTKHERLDHAGPSQLARQDFSASLPSDISRILADHRNSSSKRATFTRMAVSSRQKLLAPSTLPPASCFLSDNESPSGTDPNEDEDGDDAVSITKSVDSYDDAPKAAPLRIEMDYASSNASDDGREGPGSVSEHSDDGSVDMLATARELDPETVRARELEYDADIAEQLAEVIPAGSSAATAGGGSGFNTPAVRHGVNNVATAK